MSYRVRGMGMDRELERKIEEKYSIDDECEVIDWILSVYAQLDMPIDPPEGYPDDVGKDRFQLWLKDGHILCGLMNALAGERVCRPQETSSIRLLAMRRNKEIDNIGKFLTAAEKYGLHPIDLFQTVCLYEKTNMPQVITTLYKLGAVSQKNGWDGPVIGVKMADKNERRFDENKLREGRSIIGLQMGTNQVASQQGMTPYGLGRQLVSKNPL